MALKPTPIEVNKPEVNRPEVKTKAVHHLVVYEKATDIIVQCIINDPHPNPPDMDCMVYGTCSFMLPEDHSYIGRPLIDLEEIDGSHDPNTIGWDELGKAIRHPM